MDDLLNYLVWIPLGFLILVCNWLWDRYKELMSTVTIVHVFFGYLAIYIYWRLGNIEKQLMNIGRMLAKTTSQTHDIVPYLRLIRSLLLKNMEPYDDEDDDEAELSDFYELVPSGEEREKAEAEHDD